MTCKIQAYEVLILLNWTGGSDLINAKLNVSDKTVLILLNWTGGSDKNRISLNSDVRVLILLNWTGGSDTLTDLIIQFAAKQS